MVYDIKSTTKHAIITDTTTSVNIASLKIEDCGKKSFRETAEKVFQPVTPLYCPQT